MPKIIYDATLDVHEKAARLNGLKVQLENEYPDGNVPVRDAAKIMHLPRRKMVREFNMEPFVLGRMKYVHVHALIKALKIQRRL